jgi:hypothetical protein
MHENFGPPLLVLGSPVEGRREKRRRNSFHYSSRKQLLRARMIRRLPRIAVVDLLGTTRNLTYGGIVSCEATTEAIVEAEPISCRAQPGIASSCSDWNQYINEEEEEEVAEQEEQQEEAVLGLELEPDHRSAYKMVKKYPSDISFECM